FGGVASHAGSAPDKGRNALNAVIRFFVGIDGWRQQLDGDARVHGVITDGGKAMNVVPARAEAIFGLRAKTKETLDAMVERFSEIARGAALLTGTTVEITEYLPYYAPVSANARLGDVIAKELGRLGVTPARGVLVTASGDLVGLSRGIHADPELAYQERRAVERITTLLAKHGHRAERPLGGLETAFRARVGPPGPSVAFMAEYDALPEVGHGCGHNLIAM